MSPKHVTKSHRKKDCLLVSFPPPPFPTTGTAHVQTQVSPECPRRLAENFLGFLLFVLLWELGLRQSLTLVSVCFPGSQSTREPKSECGRQGTQFLSV